jgi:predicted amidohydrolase YtcJ
MIRVDKTFYNGKIYTMNTPGETVEAIAVHDGKIVFAGTSEEALTYPSKERVDMDGYPGLPGFSDTHIHVLMDCLYASYVDLSGAQSVADVVRIMKEHDDSAPGWLRGAAILSENLIEKRFPQRYELDEISTERPIIITSHCGHIFMINSTALAHTAIANRNTFDDECLDYYKDGESNGIIMERAYGKYLSTIVDGAWSAPSYMKALVKEGLPAYSKHGHTTLHAIGLMPESPPTEHFDQYFQLEKSGDLPLRVVINPSDPLPWSLEPITGFGTDMVKLGSKKIFLDGSMGGHTAAFLEPYSDAPEEMGIFAHTEEELTRMFQEAYDAGLEVSVHAIGDAAMERVLNSAERVYPSIDETDPFKRLAQCDKRLRIIHAALIKPAHIGRLKKLPVMLDVQPGAIHSDVQMVEARIGADRLKYLMPFRTFIDNGILLTGGSDAPVDPPIPLNGIQCAVTRRDLNGLPDAGLQADEAISVYEAVAMYTKNAAYCSNEENDKGTISVGKYADFILLDRDIFEADPQDIHNIKVVKTVVGGDVKWEQPQLK